MSGPSEGGRGRETVAAPRASRLKITRIRLYEAPQPRATFNQSNAVVTVETDQGLTGIGEGGTRDMVEQLAGLLIGEDASRIEHLWQLMYRGYFYPPGREKLHAQGALDLALWDIRGKALGVPVYQLLGGLTREHVPCYATAFPDRGSPRETARACIEAGFKAYRTHGADPGDDRFDSRVMVRRSSTSAPGSRGRSAWRSWARRRGRSLTCRSTATFGTASFGPTSGRDSAWSSTLAGRSWWASSRNTASRPGCSEGPTARSRTG